MTREFFYTAPFQRSWKAMGLDNNDQKLLEETLLKNPQADDVIEGTGGSQKIRIQFECRGKSGGDCIIYVDAFEKEKLYLLLAYPKNVQDNLTPEQKKMIQKLIETIKKE